MESELAKLLEEYRDKAQNWKQQNEASQLLQMLKSVLPEQEYIDLFVAHGYFLIEENPQELIYVTNKLISKYDKK